MTDEQFDAIVADQLAQIEDRLLAATSSGNPFIAEAAGHVVRLAASASGPRWCSSRLTAVTSSTSTGW